MARRRSGKKIDFTHWTVGAPSHQAVGAGTSGVTVLTAEHEPQTLLRTRGGMTAYLDGVQAPATSVRITWGLIMVPEGTGTSVLWAPFSDGDAPWFYWTSFQLAYEEMVTDAVDIPTISGYREIVDSKAMRINRNQEIQSVVENTTTGTASSINLQATMRFLSGT